LNLSHLAVCWTVSQKFILSARSAYCTIRKVFVRVNAAFLALLACEIVCPLIYEFSGKDHDDYGWNSWRVSAAVISYCSS